MKFLNVRILFLLLLVSCSKTEPNINKLQGNVFGTTFHISYISEDSKNFKKEIDSLFQLVNSSLSTYYPDSDISKINKGDTTVVVDDFFVEVFQKSERIYKETNGIFDPTIGILVNAWGFGPGKRIENLDSLKVKQLLTFVGFDKVKIERNKLVKKYPEIYFDFNAIAKGYGIDVVSRFLENEGISNYFVEIGGEIRTKGRKSENIKWKFGIEKPSQDRTKNGNYQAILSLENKSMATSGNYRKFRIDPISGEKYVHTIDTKTGFTAKRDLLSATVVAALDCADVDGYATTFMAMGFQKTKQFLEKHPELDVFLVFLDENGAIKEYSTLLLE